MIPGARLQAAIDLMFLLLPTLEAAKGKPADALLGDYFRTNRYIGSKDRGAVAELTYYVLRNLASLRWRLTSVDAHASPRMLVFLGYMSLHNAAVQDIKSMLGTMRYEPLPLIDEEEEQLTQLENADAMPADMPLYAACNIPEWLAPILAEQYGNETEALLAALNKEAPVDLRVNTLKTTREKAIEALAKEGLYPVATPHSPIGIRLEKRGPLFATQAFRDGWFEMQDEASQLAALLVDARPGMKVIDFCAGAGGKTLALAAMMQNKGRLMAWDVSALRMEDLPKRLKRAGVDNAQHKAIESESDPFIKRHKQTADRVLVDAPCTGTGTWRRNPDLKWKLRPEAIEELVALQRRILTSAARLVMPGGRLIYVTCSLLKSENEQQVEWFLANNPQFSVVPSEKIWDKHALKTGRKDSGMFLKLIPHQDGTDGFFATALERSQTSPAS